MARHGENIYKRKDGRYEGRYVIGKTATGKTRFGYIYGYKYAEVRDALVRKKAEQARLHPPCPRGRTIPLGNWLRQWLCAEKMGSVKASSYQSYLHQMNRYLIPHIGALWLDQITPSVVHGLVSELQAEGLSAATIRGVLRLLFASLRSASDEGLIDKNPCGRIKIREQEETEQRVLSRGEYDCLCADAKAKADDLTLIGLYTGMRLGEICALKWTDIDWDGRTVTVRRTVQRVATPERGDAKTALLLGTPKSKTSRRTLPLPQFIMDDLKTLRERSSGDGFIFGSALRPAEPRTVQRRFKRFAASRGLTGVHFHTLRHSFATRLLELGVDIKTVSALLGHGSARTTLDFYAHSLTEQQRAAIARLAAL